MANPVKERYFPGNNVDFYRIAADAMPFARAGMGLWVSHQLAHEKQNPSNRTWTDAARLGTALTSDVADGWLARRSLGGPDKLGGWIDQLVGDKITMLALMRQLNKNGELPNYVYEATLARDLGMTALRAAINGNGSSTDARDWGKYKFWLQATGAVASFSPLAESHPDIHRGLFAGSAVLAGASMVEFSVSTVREQLHQVMEKTELPETVESLLIASDSILEDFDLTV